MELLPPKSWKTEFARSVDSERYRDIIRKANDEARKRDREDREDARDRQHEELLDAVVIMATEAELTEFGATLDHYDTASYEALLENERLMDEGKTRLKDMYDRAFVLPDGRRVFETEDGLHVFDEHGAELGVDIISPDELGDHLTTWEAFKAQREEVDQLTDERQQIIEFQEAVSDARERVDEGNLSQRELDDLKASLEAQVPERVLAQLPEQQRPALKANDAEEPTVASWQPAAKLDMPQL